jgi:hypothetical protein
MIRMQSVKNDLTQAVKCLSSWTTAKGDQMADERDLKSFRDAILRCCADYNADDAVRTVASDRTASHRALDRLVPVMRGLVDATKQ